MDELYRIEIRAGGSPPNMSMLLYPKEVAIELCKRWAYLGKVTYRLATDEEIRLLKEESNA